MGSYESAETLRLGRTTGNSHRRQQNIIAMLDNVIATMYRLDEQEVMPALHLENMEDFGKLMWHLLADFISMLSRIQCTLALYSNSMTALTETSLVSL